MLLIIDGNNLAWAGYYALERVMKPEDDERRHRVAMLGLAGMVLGAIARGGEPPGAAPSAVSHVALCFDEGRPLRRRQIYPPYQTGRERDPKFMRFEPTILGAIAEFGEMAVSSLPVDVVRGVNTEADDLIAALVDANPRLHKRIVSSDRDFLQLIGASTSVYSPIKKVVIDESNFFEQVTPRGAGTMFPPERFLDYRALVGDTSDDVPGVPGMGPLSAVKLLARAPIEAYYGEPAAVRAALGRKSLALEAAFADGTARAIVERNRVLMDLRLRAPCWDELQTLVQRGTWDPIRFRAWWEEQRISSVEEAVLFATVEALSAARAEARPT